MDLKEIALVHDPDRFGPPTLHLECVIGDMKEEKDLRNLLARSTTRAGMRVDLVTADTCTGSPRSGEDKKREWSFSVRALESIDIKSIRSELSMENPCAVIMQEGIVVILVVHDGMHSKMRALNVQLPLHTGNTTSFKASLTTFFREVKNAKWPKGYEKKTTTVTLLDV